MRIFMLSYINLAPKWKEKTLKGQSGIGMKKHGKGGKVVNSSHFTGKKGCKKNRKSGLTHKQRKLKRGKHTDKFQDPQ